MEGQLKIKTPASLLRLVNFLRYLPILPKDLQKTVSISGYPNGFQKLRLFFIIN